MARLSWLCEKSANGHMPFVSCQEQEEDDDDEEERMALASTLILEEGDIEQPCAPRDAASGPKGGQRLLARGVSHRVAGTIVLAVVVAACLVALVLGIPRLARQQPSIARGANAQLQELPAWPHNGSDDAWVSYGSMPLGEERAISFGAGEPERIVLRSDRSTPSPIRTTPTTTPALNRSIAAVNRSKALPTLFCWALALKGGVEPWLLVVQQQMGTGIFGCHAYTTFSDEALALGMGDNLTIGFLPDGAPVRTVAIPGEKAWLGPVSGSPLNVWHNTVVFARAYAWIRDSGLAEKHDWTVKVDPDTVFLPGILQRQIHAMYSSSRYMEKLDPTVPVYLVNCKQWYSLQGPLEMFSRAAAAKFFSGFENCQATLNWRDWGEDWFMQHCLDHLGVQEREGFNLLNDGYCQSEYGHTGHDYNEEVKMHGTTCVDGKPAYHPYKTTVALRTCILQAAAVRS